MYASGWFAEIEFAISFNSMVLPVFGWATIMARCPLPIGAKRSTILVEIVAFLPAKLNFSCGKSGVKYSNATLSFIKSKSLPFTSKALCREKYFSPSFGNLTIPFTESPVLSP